MELLTYLAKLSAYWIALYGLYALFLHRQTFLRWNRAYLLGSLVLSFALPLVQYPEAAPPLPVVYQVSGVPFAVVAEVPSPSLLSWTGLLWLVYCLGVLVMLVRLAGNLRHLFSFLQKGDRLPMEGYTLVLLNGNAVGSFSFMKWIFISAADYARNFDTILTHELVHVRQRHSWDILLMEILHVVFWFNPIIVLYKKALQQVHEFLADSRAETSDRDAYAKFLISYAISTPITALTNQFFNSKLLKSRIIMLYKKKNSNWSLGKYAAVALLMGFSTLMVASCEREVVPSSSNGEQLVKGNINVTGSINTPDHKPLMGATITDSQGKKGTTTDAAGRFSLKVPAGSSLRVSASGLGAMDLKVNPKYRNAEYDITMSSKSNNSSTMTFSPSTDGQSLKVTVQTGEINGETVFSVVEKTPEYPGGVQELFKYLGENIKYPEAALKDNVQGKVFVTFVVTTEGEIRDVQILKGLGSGTDEESIRVVSKMPRWKPGMQDGRVVNVRYNLPIMFQLDDDKEIKANEDDKKVGQTESGTFSGASPESPTRIYTGAEKALVVLDGVIQKADYDLQAVDPKKIEVINVLKGQKATEKYGAKGAKGVVEVTTKKK